MKSTKIKTSRKAPVQKRRVKKTRPGRSYATSRTVANKTGEGMHRRSMLVVFVLSLGFSFIGARLAWVALVPPVEPRVSLREMPLEAPRRGDIVDRHGTLLATTLKVFSLYADPKRVMDAAEVETKLAQVLPEVNQQRLRRHLNQKNRRFVWVKRHLTPEQAHQVNSLGLPGLGFREEFVRVYPHQTMAAHILGGMSVDGRGIAGVESAMNEALRQGEKVQLTLDSRMQAQLRRTLFDAQQQAAAKAAWGVVMDPQTGDILAMANVPDYDPNHVGAYPATNRMNRATLGAYEMGSTFKLFALALGLETGKIGLDTEIDCSKPLQIGKYTIRDFHAKKRILNATEILRYSSNIGAAQIADMAGGQAQQEFFAKLGLLTPVDLGLPELGHPTYPDRWGRIHTMTMAYGHGIAVTSLQLAAAVNTLVTDGKYRSPRLLMNRAMIEPKSVVDPRTVADVKELMRDVVHHGSGRNAQVKGLDIGGKTGTAEKVASTGGYSEDKNLVSFIGAVPLDKPELLILIMVDEPKKGYETGGRIAAPAFKNFVQRTALQVGLLPQTEESRTTKHSQSLLERQRSTTYAAFHASRPTHP